MKTLVILAALFSLQVSANETSKLLCTSNQNYATVQIEENCMSIEIYKVTNDSHRTCPRCADGERYLPMHKFSTCNVAPYQEHFTVSEINDAEGKKISYSAHSKRCLRSGCSEYDLDVTLLNRTGNGAWLLKSVNSVKTGSFGDNVTEKFELPANLPPMTCKKI